MCSFTVVPCSRAFYVPITADCAVLTSQGSVISHSVAQCHHQSATVTAFEDGLDVHMVEQCGDSV